MRRLPVLAALVAAGCLSRPPEHPVPPVVRHGLERLRIAYDDPRAAEKQVLFERINRDRAAHGVAPVQWEPRAALVGDAFCLDAALAGSWGHWDLQGRPPYLRWGLAGGVDFHAQNAAMVSVTPGPIQTPLVELLLRTHESMMAEQPPDDGHRRTVLDPRHTHVGIGVASVGGEFRMSEEFTTVAFDWVETPPAPIPPGHWAAFRGRPLPGWEVGVMEVRHEAPPRPLSLADLRKRRSYGFPPVLRSVRVRGGQGRFEELSGRRDDVRLRAGEISFEFPLDHGPGHYYVLAYVRRAGRNGEFWPATAALVTATP